MVKLLTPELRNGMNIEPHMDSPDHDDLTVPDVAATIGRDLTATNSLLARARGELRRLGRGDGDD